MLVFVTDSVFNRGLRGWRRLFCYNGVVLPGEQVYNIRDLLQMVFIEPFIAFAALLMNFVQTLRHRLIFRLIRQK